jgi:hypothetical protein
MTVVKTSKLTRRRTSEKNEAQLQFTITHGEIAARFNDLELFLAAPERIGQLREHVVSHRPTHVFDLRTVPSFDGPHTSRREVLQSMSSAGVRYVDVMAMVENDGSLAPHVIDFCARTAAVHALNRSIVFLFESIRDLLWSSSILPSAFVQHTAMRWHTNFIGINLDPTSFEYALKHWSSDIPPVDRWMVGTILHVTAPTPAVTHHGSYTNQANVAELARGSAVRVLSTYSDFSADVLVLSGPQRGETVRLPLTSKFASVIP